MTGWGKIKRKGKGERRKGSYQSENRLESLSLFRINAREGYAECQGGGEKGNGKPGSRLREKKMELGERDSWAPQPAGESKAHEKKRDKRRKIP